MLRKWIRAWLWICCLLVTRGVEGGNFVSSDPVITQAAEQARLRSALFWSGSDLPGNWSAPCPIQIVSMEHSGSGRTRFRMEKGEVFGWQMEITGTREAILQDVIPHEVDHMVRASLTRRAQERWLDEGCAVLMESESVHQHLRKQALRAPPEIITERWLQADRYPEHPSDVQSLYAVGFSLVEYLLSRGTVATLLAFQRDPDTALVKLKRFYDLDLISLRTGWSVWRKRAADTSCAAAGCQLHAPQELTGSPVAVVEKPLLVIWTAAWCGPCRKLKADLAESSAFRNELERNYQLRFRDFDSNTTEAAAEGVFSLPTFRVAGRSLQGYAGPEDLLRRLAATRPAVEPALVGEEQEGGAGGTVAAPSTSISSPVEHGGETSSAPPEGAYAHAGGFLEGAGEAVFRWWPMTLSVLQLTGVVGGTLATGGVGGAVIASLMLLARLRRIKSAIESRAGVAEGSAVAPRAPFPRELDEAGELLELRQTEGRVATLDTLRGMFLDDELEKLEQTDPAGAQLAMSLRKSIAARVDEVAPLTTAH